MPPVIARSTIHMSKCEDDDNHENNYREQIEFERHFDSDAGWFGYRSPTKNRFRSFDFFLIFRLIVS